jgi:hypothetical protein
MSSVCLFGILGGPGKGRGFVAMAWFIGVGNRDGGAGRRVGEVVAERKERTKRGTALNILVSGF